MREIPTIEEPVHVAGLAPTEVAHNYQLAEAQDIADFVGDSLELSRQAAATDAEVIAGRARTPIEHMVAIG